MMCIGSMDSGGRRHCCAPSTGLKPSPEQYLAVLADKDAAAAQLSAIQSGDGGDGLQCRQQAPVRSVLLDAS